MIYTHVAAFLAGLALAAASTWHVQAWRYDAQIGDIRTQYAQAKLKRSEAARADEIQTAAKESTHAADTSKNSDEFTTSQPVRDAIARAELAAAERMRLDQFGGVLGRPNTTCARAGGQTLARSCRQGNGGVLHQRIGAVHYHLALTVI